ncbi:hypothetical protein DQ04_00451030 [Trypanosoma grayi]|uniref:hypothetical protein n=1 Tax=Trypanosoma grayi TaxID=71804 RepID=UPI0004F46AF7|nr:hypothetical protein DQ04_00451030 [Trypanosoma grayi]KEG14464.1 hypothetical protein DQ04_00451030 [Trypanosoma grayi]
MNGMRGSDESRDTSPPRVLSTRQPLAVIDGPAMSRSKVSPAYRSKSRSSSGDSEGCISPLVLPAATTENVLRIGMKPEAATDGLRQQKQQQAMKEWEQQRYRALLPLNWGSRSACIVMLARDAITGRLVTTRRYCYRCDASDLTCECIVSEDPVDGRLVPFTPLWKSQMRGLRNLRHTCVNQVLDVLMDNEKQELLSVHAYVDGMQPLAAALGSYPCLIHHAVTPLHLLHITQEVIAGVLFLHNHGIVHGALSPWTILLDPHGHACVTGFAVAHVPPQQSHRHFPAAVDDGAGRSGAHCNYTLPEWVPKQQQEQLPPFQCHAFTEAADVFAIIAVLFTMTSQNHDALSVDLRKAAAGVLQKDPQHGRPLVELAACLEELASPRNKKVHTAENVDKQQQQQQRNESTLPRGGTCLKRSRWWFVALAVIFCMALIHLADKRRVAQLMSRMQQQQRQQSEFLLGNRRVVPLLSAPRPQRPRPYIRRRVRRGTNTGL